MADLQQHSTVRDPDRIATASLEIASMTPL
jgi:hypothetical protein